MTAGLVYRQLQGLNMIDATRIVPGLHQGSVPTSVASLLGAGFHNLVLAAVEIQPPDHALVGIDVLRCPLTDDPTRPLTPDEWLTAFNCAAGVALRLRKRRRVLVTCAQGLNRSGLISALTLMVGAGWDPGYAVRWIRNCRPGALSNPQFVSALLHRTQIHRGMGCETR